MFSQGVIERLRAYLYPPPTRTISLDDFIARANTGDIMLWTSNGISAFLLNIFIRCGASHVSTVLRRPDGLFVAQSTTHVKMLDRMTGERGRDGVQLNEMRTAILEYLAKTGARIVVRFLCYRDGTPLEQSDIAQLSEEFDRGMHAMRGMDFDFGPLDLLAAGNNSFAALPWPLGGEQDNDDKIFCAGLVAKLFMRADILKSRVEACFFSPASFSQDTQALPFEKKYSLSEEMLLVAPAWEVREYAERDPIGM